MMQFFKLNKEFMLIQGKYELLQEQWLNAQHSEVIELEYKEVSQEYFEAKKQYVKLKRDIFDDLCRATKATMQASITGRLDIAYRHLEQGKYREANQFLALEGIVSDIDHLYKKKGLYSVCKKCS